jgi:hypothetical protein
VATESFLQSFIAAGIRPTTACVSVQIAIWKIFTRRNVCKRNVNGSGRNGRNGKRKNGKNGRSVKQQRPLKKASRRIRDAHAASSSELMGMCGLTGVSFSVATVKLV